MDARAPSDMKIILSRKGFDSSYGGVASPILPGGELVSLPIPERPGMVTAETRTYGQIQAGAWTAGHLAADLTGGRIGPGDPAHLDPDLHPASVRRPRGWRPVFGQTGAAETHLQNQGVGPGDVFLFFGWFREVERAPTGTLRYRRDAPDRHVFFGWLQVEERLPVAPLTGLPGWTRGHPHHKPTPYGRPDCVYVATERLRLPGTAAVGEGLPGGGTFGTYRPALCLTAEGRTRSHWRLPAWFHPVGGRLPLSYHRSPKVWQPGEGHVLLDAARQGQEFVLDTRHYPEAAAWVAGLFAEQAAVYQRIGTS